METIRKKINLDACKCHRNSLVPFCPFDENGEMPINVDAGIYNGDYGQFACDLVFMSCSAISEDEKVSYSEEEISRFRFLDLLRRYDFIQGQIKNGIAIKRAEDNVVYYSAGTEACQYDFVYSSYGEIWTTNVPEHEKYDYMPMDADLFYLDNEGHYVYAGDEETISGITELLLISDYDVYMRYEEDWEDWWENGFSASTSSADTWEEAYLDSGYTEPNFFKFCQDFEKYFLGKVNVPQTYSGETLSGSKVPEIVFYLNFKEYIDWFDRNRKFLGSDKNIEQEWERRGGDLFYNFLINEVKPLWIERPVIALDTLPEGEYNFTYFTYMPPYADLDVLMTDDSVTESEFYPYEYSVVSAITENGSIIDVLSGATEEYVCPESGVGSALTPHFVDFSDVQEKYYTCTGVLSGSVSGFMVSGSSKYWDFYYEEINEEDIPESAVVQTIEYLDEDSKYIEKWADSEPDYDPYIMVKVQDNKKCNTRAESQLSTLYSKDAIHLGDGVFGVFETFKNASGDSVGQLFECVYHTGTTSSPNVKVYYSGYTYDYGIIDRSKEYGSFISGDTREYVPEYVQNKHVVNETFYGEFSETPPYVESNCYQVVGFEVLSEDIISIVSADTPVVTRNADNMILSEFTRWSANTQYTYGWWECTKVDYDESIRCADGEYVSSGENDKYQNAMLLSNIPNIALSEQDGDIFYFMAVYDNGKVAPNGEWVAGETFVTDAAEIDDANIKFMLLPFDIGVPVNIRSFSGVSGEVIAYDIIKYISADNDSDVAEIGYVIGATSGTTDSAETEALLEVTGIHYLETYPYATRAAKLPVDGAHMAQVFYETIDYDSKKTTIYNEEYGLSRKAITAIVTGMEVGSPWTREGAIRTKLITRGGIESTKSGAKYDISLAFDRGTAAAWESYFKLSECNTLNDLLNYGNNTFNL